MAGTAGGSRIAWLDVARFLGMFLIYYGHVVESVYQAGNEAAFGQYKLVYSFHVVLFFVISGYLARDQAGPVLPRLRYLALSRLLPVLFFSLLALPFHLALDSWVMEMLQHRGWGQIGLSHLRGWPLFNFITWFLVALFVVELFHLAIRPLTRTPVRLGLSIVLFGVAGWFIALRVTPFQDVWFVQEAVLLYAWYQLGLALRRSGLLADSAGGRVGAALGLAASAAVLLLTYDLNQGPWKASDWNDDWRVVLINLSIHGNPLWFTVTTAAGCAATLLLARLLPPLSVLTYLGRHTLILMGLNGFFYVFVNEPIIELVMPPAATLSVAAYCTAFTAVSLLLCLPLIWLLSQYVPQLVGQPRRSGPLLPALCRAPRQ